MHKHHKTKPIKKFLKDIVTGADQSTADIARILWLQCTQVYIGLTIYAMYKGNWTFDPVIWGSGLAAIAGGFGAAIFAKAGTEPPPPTAMMIKTGGFELKQSNGRAPMHDGGDSDGDSDSSPSSDDTDPPAPAPTDAPPPPATAQKN